jgi:hypothetical protein
MKHQFYLTLLLSLWISNISNVWAVPNVPNDQTAVLKAQEQIAIAKKLLKAEQLTDAIKAYQKANEIFPDPKNLFVIASLYGKTNQCKDALNTWDLFFKECQDCNYRDKAITIYDEQRKKCIITVSIESTPTNAKVFYKGENWGMTPFSKQLIADSYELEIEHPLALPNKYDLKLNAGQAVYEINLKLKLETQKVEKTDPVIIPKKEVEVPVSADSQIIYYQTSSIATSLIGIGTIAFAVSSYIAASNQADEASKQMGGMGGWSQEQYDKAKSEFSSNLTMGHLFLGVGLVSLSASSWLIYQGWLKPKPQVNIQSNTPKVQSQIVLSPSGFGVMGSF